MLGLLLALCVSVCVCGCVCVHACTFMLASVQTTVSRERVWVEREDDTLFKVWILSHAAECLNSPLLTFNLLPATS